MHAAAKKLLSASIEAFCIGLAYALGIGIVAALAVVLYAHAAHAAGEIPRAAQQYRSELVRVSRAVWGLDAPIATFAAQIHTESWWRNDTVSHVGAQGLAQFMPATARWLPSVAPETGQPAPFNPGWSLRALCTYDKWLWDRVSRAAGACDRMAFTLSGYNGGPGWVQRDRAEAARRGLDAARYDQVKAINAGRRPAAWKENREYVRLIMDVRQHLYLSWGSGVTCD